MFKSVIVAATSAAFATEDVVFDSGLSLLQMRAQKHESLQEPIYFMQARNTVCKPEEVLTFAQCEEAMQKQIIPNAHQSWHNIHNARGKGRAPSGCFMNNPPGQQMYFNDEPAGSPHATASPICGKSGGRAAEILAGLTGSCQDETCKVPWPDHHLLAWGPNVVVPELQILNRGDTCEACGLLSYAQCAKAGDTGILNTMTGQPVKHEMSIQTWGPGNARGAVPSGCSVNVHPGQNHLNFSPFDTVDGALAGMTTSSGVGSGFQQMAPVCLKVCPEPELDIAKDLDDEDAAAAVDDGAVDDGAAAVGDPHMHTASHEKYDLADSSLNK